MEDRALSAEVVLSTSGQHEALICPSCGETAIAEIRATSDSTIRYGGLILSGILMIMFGAAHIYFAWYGKVLPVPDYFWPLIAAPWVGYGAGKLADSAINKIRQ